MNGNTRHEVPVFFTKHEWDYIQSVLAQDKTAGSKYCWHFVKTIDRQLGGNYPKNYNW